MDVVDWARAAAALVLTLGLIAAAALAARRMGMLQGPVTGGRRRLAISESLFLDPRRRLVIVNVDGAEHVLLLSPFGDRPIAALERPAAPEPQP